MAASYVAVHCALLVEAENVGSLTSRESSVRGSAVLHNMKLVAPHGTRRRLHGMDEVGLNGGDCTTSAFWLCGTLPLCLAPWYDFLPGKKPIVGVVAIAVAQNGILQPQRVHERSGNFWYKEV
jgi:hypothetical protein